MPNPDPSASPSTGSPIAERLGIRAGMIVQELGYDEDTDESVAVAIEKFLGTNLVDADSDEVIDAVLFWYRDGDGDLVDLLVDAIGPLAEDGVIWLLTPKRGRDGYVEASDISEAAPTAGLTQTSMISVGPDWAGARLAPRRARPEKR
ncbi:MAG: DUF3052 domain-containing protein [Jatrophihabitans sp.]